MLTMIHLLHEDLVMKSLRHVHSWDHMDCSLPSSSVHSILDARILECSFYQDFGENNPHSHFFVCRLADQSLPGQEILSTRPCISSLICYLPSWVNPQQSSFFPLSFVPIEQDKVCSEAKESFILSSKRERCNLWRKPFLDRLWAGLV